jgi:hypothetical protein
VRPLNGARVFDHDKQVVIAVPKLRDCFIAECSPALVPALPRTNLPHELHDLCLVLCSIVIAVERRIHVGYLRQRPGGLGKVQLLPFDVRKRDSSFSGLFDDLAKQELFCFAGGAEPLHPLILSPCSPGTWKLPVSRILRYFGLTSVRLMSNNPGKVAAVEPAGVVVAERAPCIADDIDTRAAYFATKRDKMGHLL